MLRGGGLAGWSGRRRRGSSTVARGRLIYIAIGVTVDGERDALVLLVGPSGGEGAKLWLTVLTEIKNRGAEDVCIEVCDGLKGL